MMKEFNEYLNEVETPSAIFALQSTGKNGEGMYDDPARAASYFVRLAKTVHVMGEYIARVQKEFEAISEEDTNTLLSMENASCMQKLVDQLEKLDLDCIDKTKDLLAHRASDIQKG